jgi:hypothetical protein
VNASDLLKGKCDDVLEFPATIAWADQQPPQVHRGHTVTLQAVLDALRATPKSDIIIRHKNEIDLDQFYWKALGIAFLRRLGIGRMIMAIQIVMDHTGDTRHHFNPENARALAKAEERFKKLTGLGFTAAVRTASGEVFKVRSFDPNAEETVFFPRLVGG